MQDQLSPMCGTHRGHQAGYQSNASRTTILRTKPRNSTAKPPNVRSETGIHINRQQQAQAQELPVHRLPTLEEAYPYRKVSDSTDDGYVSSYEEELVPEMDNFYHHHEHERGPPRKQEPSTRPQQRRLQLPAAERSVADSKLSSCVASPPIEWIPTDFQEETEHPVVRTKPKSSQKKRVSQAVRTNKQAQTPQPAYLQKLKTEICKNFELQGWCHWGDQCSYAHGEAELQSKKHLNSNYKRKICVNYHVHGYCAYGLR